ncbi:MAG: hypothetical protein AAF721_36535 [Myxococcota bacterium]
MPLLLRPNKHPARRRSGSPARRRWGRVAGGLSLVAPLVLSTGCPKKTTGPMPICLTEVAGEEADEVKSQDMPPDVWFAVILRDFNRREMKVKRPTKDCSGRTLAPEDEEMNLCMDGDNPPVPLEARPLDAEEDFTITALDEPGQALVWVRTDHYEGGLSEGPVAIAEWTKRGVAVRAIGPLTAHTDRVRMHLEPMGKERVLVVESRICEDPEKPKTCGKQTRLVPLVGERFVQRPLLDKDGETCLGAAAFDQSQETEVPLPDGRTRKFTLSRSFDYTDGNVVLSEEVKIEDYDPEKPDLPATLFRKAQLQREMLVTDRGLLTSEGLWDRLLHEHGSVELAKPKPASEAEDGAAEPAAEG